MSRLSAALFSAEPRNLFFPSCRTDWPLLLWRPSRSDGAAGGREQKLEKYRALMDVNGLIFIIFFVDLMVSKLTFLLFSVQEKQRCSAQESKDNEEGSNFCDFLPELFISPLEFPPPALGS